MTRIETSNAVAATLVDDAPRERVDLTPQAADIDESADATYTVEVTAHLPASAPVAANAGVRSVVDNLVENAVDHNDADDPRVHVQVETGDDTVRLTVRDNAPGVPDDRKRAASDSSGAGRSVRRRGARRGRRPPRNGVRRRTAALAESGGVRRR